MGKPSIFSKDYEKMMRRRRINITLIILIIISVVYFFGDRFIKLDFLKKFNFAFFEKMKIEKRVEDKKTQEPKNKENVKESQKEVKNIKVEKYKKSDGSILEFYIDTVKGEIVEIKDLKGETNYNMSQSKKFSVFDDIKAGKILFLDSQGKVKELTRDYYRSSKLNKNFYRKDILASNPDYIWAAKPYIAYDERILFLSELPYFKKEGSIHLWYIDLKSNQIKRITDLNIKDINLVEFIGYDENGVKIKVGTDYYILKKDNYKLVKS